MESSSLALLKSDSPCICFSMLTQTTTAAAENWPMMSKKSSAKTAGPLSIGLPDPLNTRPANTHTHTHLGSVLDWPHWDICSYVIPSMSSETGVRRMSPVNSQLVFLASIPEVPSNTCRGQRGEQRWIVGGYGSDFLVLPIKINKYINNQSALWLMTPTVWFNTFFKNPECVERNIDLIWTSKILLISLKAPKFLSRTIDL